MALQFNVTEGLHRPTTLVSFLSSCSARRPSVAMLGVVSDKWLITYTHAPGSSYERCRSLPTG